MIAAISSGVVATGLLLHSWSSPASSHWSQVPPPELFVTSQPKQEDLPGTYFLIRQTITTNGLVVLQGRQCQLDLPPDGSFTITNFPRWSPLSNTQPRVTAFISATGRWRCETVSTLFNNKRCWGVVFSDPQIPSLELRSKGAPYDLMLTYGEGDDGAVMLFGKKK